MIFTDTYLILLHKVFDTRTATTNASGYFRLSDVALGASYTFEARAKNYDFTQSAQIFNITEEIDDIRFVSTAR